MTSLEQAYPHFDEVSSAPGASFFDVGDVCAEGGDALALQAASRVLLDDKLR